MGALWLVGKGLKKMDNDAKFWLAESDNGGGFQKSKRELGQVRK